METDPGLELSVLRLCSLEVLSQEMAPWGLESPLMVSPALLAPPCFWLVGSQSPVLCDSAFLGEPFPDVFFRNLRIYVEVKIILILMELRQK